MRHNYLYMTATKKSLSTLHHLAPRDRQTLERWVRSSKTPQRLAFRSRIVLEAAGGASIAATARRLRTTRPTVRHWIQRFGESGPLALTTDAPGRGRPHSLGDAVRHEIAALRPSEPTNSIVAADVARRFRTSVSTVRRIWRSPTAGDGERT